MQTLTHIIMILYNIIQTICHRFAAVVFICGVCVCVCVCVFSRFVLLLNVRFPFVLNLGK
jgi:hypothetical protein